ncbi:hypothetical protein [Candidatus Methylacidithermus pantelleriae]|uniref:Uncharacterized protein n=1 Tax=Candidatus Methylacidithermus pantelleriae TaxID=2744239 RepID=A0A8J2BTS1_9BACT|nr:hypothetical protein [Candidatus Methylacidithermus pantelleriae]CAF0699938.1 hypothetical protein MPNT_310017 [Candidatus Methylacidithermus pantelleriae]
MIGERRPELIEEVKEGIRRAQKVIRKHRGKKPGSNVLHEKKRQLAILWRDQA